MNDIYIVLHHNSTNKECIMISYIITAWLKSYLTVPLSLKSIQRNINK